LSKWIGERSLEVPPRRPWRRGRLRPDAWDGAPCRAADDPRRPTAGAHIVVAFADGLRELGHMEGRNVMFEYRWAEGQPERFAAMAADLVRQPVEILPGPPAPRGRLRPHRGTGHDLPSPVSPGASAPGPKFAPESIRSHSRGLPRTVTGGIPMTAEPRKPIRCGRYRIAASVAAWVTSCWAASHWLARCVRAVLRTVSALAN